MTIDFTDEESLDFLSSDVSKRRRTTAEDDDVDVGPDVDPGHNPTFGTKDVTAATRYSDGDKVETSDGTRGVVVEIETEPFDGPSGEEVDASPSSPAYVVATVDGAEVVTASDLVSSEWSTDIGTPDEKLADDQGADDAAALEAAASLSLEAGVKDFDYPESWKESEKPNRLILLDAWAGMNGQFSCGGGCCKGTMMKSGMGDRASNQFCAALKDRVLLWEGWRKGG